MSRKDTDFFAALGARVAALRKAAGMTQVQLAEILECSQQHLVAYEKGRYRIPANLLLLIAEQFEVSLDELFGIRKTPGKPGPLSKMERQIELVSRLPKAKQRFVSEMLDTVLEKAS